MPLNTLNADFPEKDYEEVLNAIRIISERMPFLVNLTADEKKSLPKFGDKSLPFVNKCHELAVHNPDFLPRSFSVEEMGRDVNLFNKLFNIMQSISIINEKIEDTYKEAGAEAYAAALTVYSTAKLQGKNLGGMEAVLDELGKRFARKSSKDDSPTHQV